MRRCVGCGVSFPKQDLLRVARLPAREGEPPRVTLDLTGKLPGRGAYLCPNLACLKAARKAKRLERHLGAPISQEVTLQLERMIAARDEGRVIE